VGRVKDYILKSVREAKVHTAWLRPDIAYEDSFLAFVEKVLDPDESNQFIEAFLPFQKSVASYGIFNSLSQTLLKYTAPGVPDTYQGMEFWDLSMVDPDNRRPVDYSLRISALKDIKEKSQTDILKLIDQLFSSKEDGRIKLFLTYELLQARKANLAVFQKGDYLPLEVSGKFKDHIVAFARSDGNKMAIAIAPRFLTSLIQPGEYPLGQKVWDDTCLQLPPEAPSAWKDAITEQMMQANGSLPVGEALKHFPVALLISNED
jgi:(1->4)-alpha-D-glucan 1-alpha-D-glucosylmutase